MDLMAKTLAVILIIMQGRSCNLGTLSGRNLCTGSEGVWLCAVTVNGEQLTMTKGETELEMIPYVEGGEMVLLWQKHREGLGNAVEITTGQFRSPAMIVHTCKNLHDSGRSSVLLDFSCPSP